MNIVERKFEKVVSPVQQFIQSQTSGGILLMLATLAAIGIANSPYHHVYHSLLEVKIGFYINELYYGMTIHHWINDGLMVFLFYLLGLEIKREVLAGELSDIRESSVVIYAAIGGMLLPALIFVGFNPGGDAIQGWGIPMATDAAFVLGLLSILGNRVPAAAKVFLVGVAIVDDIGAVLVIALFYTELVKIEFLLLAAVIFSSIWIINILGVRKLFPYALASILLWVATTKAGVHGTVAGILAALAVPARPKKEPEAFAEDARNLIEEFEDLSMKNDQDILASKRSHKVIESVQKKTELATTPLQSWERALENPVGIIVVPLFAFFNAGIVINLSAVQNLFSSNITTGVFFGLVVGKLIGISLSVWAVLKLKIGKLPDSIDFRHIIGISMLAGMGFTMSIFITNLGYAEHSLLLEEAKMGVILATAVAGALGMLWMFYISRNES